MPKIALAQDAGGATQNIEIDSTLQNAEIENIEIERTGSGKFLWFFWTEIALMIVVFIGLPALARFKDGEKSAPLKGLNLPEGSVRSMLALITIGSFVNFLLFGSYIEGDHFDKILAAFGALSGAVIGFYFGHRGASSQNEK